MKNFLLTLTRKAMTIAGVCVFTGLAAGAAGGVFRVSDTKRVYFSQGNLQFRTTGKHRCADGTEQTDTWRFAEKQYGFAGNSADVGPACTEWFGTFPWATSGWNSGAKCYQPWSKSNSSDSYFYWSASVHPNQISNVDAIYMKKGLVQVREQGFYRSNACAVRLVQDYVEGVEVVEREALPAKFHVSDDKQVRFSGGNLQYLTETEQWIFAPAQYNIRGNANLRVTAAGDTVFGKALDLSGWSTRYKRAAFGISLYDASLYKDTTFVDWGGNAIINSGNQPDQWRTLTQDEWLYLFRHTPWTIVQVEGVWGCMLVPDEDALPHSLLNSL